MDMLFIHDSRKMICYGDPTIRTSAYDAVLSAKWKENKAFSISLDRRKFLKCLSAAEDYLKLKRCGRGRCGTGFLRKVSYWKKKSNICTIYTSPSDAESYAITANGEETKQLQYHLFNIFSQRSHISRKYQRIIWS